jgi:hypothetical protein
LDWCIFSQGQFLQGFLTDKNHHQNLFAWVLRVLVLIVFTFFIGISAAPVKIGGIYTADSEITTKTDGSTKVTPSMLLALKLEFTELNGILKGNLTATTRNLFIPLTFTFAFNGKLSNALMHIKVNVGICLEYPTMTLDATVNPDGIIEISKSTQVVRCNFEDVRISLLRRVVFVHELTKK